MKVVWTEQAFERLSRIEDFVGADDPVAAAGLIDRLVERTLTLEEFPRIGRRLPEVPGSELRELVEGSYRIVYRLRDDCVEVLTVFDGHRLLRSKELG